jgi:hypothetical protein
MKRVILALSLVVPLAGTVQASLEPSVEPLTVSVQREPVNTVVPIYRAYMNVGTEKFAFIVPENFRLAGDTAHGRLQLENTVAGTFMTFNFLHSPGSASPETGKEVYREWLSSRYANGKFVGEFSRPAAAATGTGFDVQWARQTPSGSNIVQRTRSVFVPTSAGLLEVSITTSVKNAKAGESDLDAVLGSLAASNGGTLMVHHVAAAN